ncbi:MAG: hypothetical protein NUW37_12895 [Planctomycetes bacterium]|nr:hypothetical protein [Planctomycetota bacterium]
MKIQGKVCEMPITRKLFVKAVVFVLAISAVVSGATTSKTLEDHLGTSIQNIWFQATSLADAYLHSEDNEQYLNALCNLRDQYITPLIDAPVFFTTQRDVGKIEVKNLDAAIDGLNTKITKTTAARLKENLRYVSDTLAIENLTKQIESNTEKIEKYGAALAEVEPQIEGLRREAERLYRLRENAQRESSRVESRYREQIDRINANARQNDRDRQRRIQTATDVRDDAIDLINGRINEINDQLVPVEGSIEAYEFLKNEIITLAFTNKDLKAQIDALEEDRELARQLGVEYSVQLEAAMKELSLRTAEREVSQEAVDKAIDALDLYEYYSPYIYMKHLDIAPVSQVAYQ